MSLFLCFASFSLLLSFLCLFLWHINWWISVQFWSKSSVWWTSGGGRETGMYQGLQKVFFQVVFFKQFTVTDAFAHSLLSAGLQDGDWTQTTLTQENQRRAPVEEPEEPEMFWNVNVCLDGRGPVLVCLWRQCPAEPLRFMSVPTNQPQPQDPPPKHWDFIPPALFTLQTIEWQILRWCCVMVTRSALFEWTVVLVDTLQCGVSGRDMYRHHSLHTSACASLWLRWTNAFKTSLKSKSYSLYVCFRNVCSKTDGSQPTLQLLISLRSLRHQLYFHILKPATFQPVTGGNFALEIKFYRRCTRQELMVHGVKTRQSKCVCCCVKGLCTKECVWTALVAVLVCRDLSLNSICVYI